METMEIKRILSKVTLVILLTVCYVPTVQGQFFKKLLKEVLTVPKQSSQRQTTQRSYSSASKEKSVLIFDVDKIYQQKIDIVLADDDLYKYPPKDSYYNHYEIVSDKVRKYPELTYSPALYDKAMTGDPVAQNKLGYCYYVGLGVGQDYKKSKFFFIESAKNGMSESIITLSRLRLVDTETDKDYMLLLKNIADKNYAPACFMYYDLFGDGEYLMKAARLLYPAAFRVLGQMAFAAEEYKESVELLNKAEELGFHHNDDTYNRHDDGDLYSAQAMYSYFSSNIEDNEKFFIMARYDPRRSIRDDTRTNANDYGSLLTPWIYSNDYTYKKLEELYKKLEAENKLTDNIKLIFNSVKFPNFNEMQQYKWRQTLEQYVATNNNIYALAELGWYYFYGKGVSEKNEEKGISFMKRAADGGLICAAKWCLENLKHKDEAAYNKYLEMVDPKLAQQRKLQEEQAKERMNNILKEMKPFAGTWKIDKFNWILTFIAEGDVTITATNTKNLSIKDPLYIYNKVVYNVTCKSVRECKTAYKVENGQLSFMESIPFNLKSIKVIKPANPNNYVREYVNKNGETIAPCPMFSAISGKVTIVSPTEIRVVGEGGQTVVLRKIR